MKRTLLFLSALLMAISGAWAQVTTEFFTMSYSAGSAKTTGTFPTTLSWKSNGTPSMTMACSGTKGFKPDNGYIFAGTYTLSVDDGYVITGYSITGRSAWNGSNGDINTITPAAGTIKDGNGNTVTSLQFAGSDATLQVSGVNSQSVSFTMAQTEGTGTGAFVATAITITAKKEKEMVDRGLYTISFVSYDGKKTWGLSSSETTASVTANTTGSTFVAHKYYNESGATRWIFVNNTDGYYLAYHAATQTFNISKPINEFKVANLTTAENNVNNNADCTSKVYMVADNRNTNETDLGCYILKEANGAFDKSAAPYYNDQFTSALYLSPVEANISEAAALAIAKFDALYAVKPYVREGRNMSVLFASSSVTSVETDINAQTTIEGAALKAETFLKSAENKKFYAVSSSATGQYLNVEETLASATSTSLTAAAVMQAEYAGNGMYYLKGVFNNKYICAPNQNNVAPATTSNKAEAATFYIGNYDNTTDNKVYFATSKKAADTTGDCEAIHYNANYENHTCGWDYDAGASQWLITAVSDDEYTALEYPIEQTLNYSLTDVNGANYSGTYTGYLMTTLPTLTGCTGYTLTNGTWNVSTKTYSATINFPFAISSNNVDNITYISSFHNKSNYSPKDFLWHANGTSVTVHYQDVPNNTKSEGVYTDEEKYEWAIFPAIADNNITFTIKNVSTGTFINNTTTGSNHNAGTVTLSETATPVQYATGSTDNCGTIYKWYIPSTSNYLSVNDVNGGTNQVLGVHETDHDGLSIGFHTPTDFAALDANLLAACTSYYTFKTGRTFGTNLGEYNGSSYESMEAAFLEATTASSLTAAQLSAHTSTLENPATKLTLNLPATGGFYRIKGYSGNYITFNNVNTNAAMNGTASTNNIIYYSSNKNLIFFGSGYGMYNTHTVAPVNSTLNTYTFSQGAQKGKYYVKSNANGMGTYCYDNTSSGTKVDRNGNPVTSSPYQTDWTLEEVTSLPVTISKYGMRTFSAPVALTIHSGVHAYTVSISGTAVTLTEVETTIPANTPVILYNHDVEWNGETVTGNEQTYDFAIDKANTANALDCELSPIIATRAKGTNDLTLQYDLTNKVFGFWKASGENINGFSAYLEWNDSYSNVRRFVITTPSTGIESVQETPMLDKNIYDVQGRRVGKASKGLYIINGKKVIL